MVFVPDTCLSSGSHPYDNHIQQARGEGEGGESGGGEGWME